ncbi:UNVERIFIED_CONTAM: hypothetical protein Scaly_1724700 [Sesamum calycinum]|uniref:Uncharacterized protein n=1 Tax=Sesamum calycinum TaxID=2727403 RepID=A0AAW2NT88_9LAMI
MMQTQRTLENQQSLMQSGQISGSLSFNGTLSKEDEEMSKSALSTFRAKEEEIERKRWKLRRKFRLSSAVSKKKPSVWPPSVRKKKPCDPMKRNRSSAA